MSDKYFTVNIRAYLDKDEPTYIGEESLYDLLSDFSCPKNLDVEYFFAYSARTAHPFQRNGAPFRFKLSKAQQVD